MINASLNWASLFGIILFFWATFAALAGVEVLTRGEKSKSLIALIIGRFVFGMLCSGILFFQGWRLDPILQFGQMLLVVGLIAESAYGLSKDKFSLQGDKKRYRSVYERARATNSPAPKKHFILWYLMVLAGIFLPLVGSFVILVLAGARFSKVEKRLSELQQAL